jgi:hypothetical protein
MKAPRLHRSSLDKSLAIGGVILILLQVLLIADVRMQIAVVLLGILVNQVGVWGLAERLMPDKRTNLKLRSEIDAFIKSVRRLNATGKESDAETLDATKAEMHESVDRIAEIAVDGVREDSSDKNAGGAQAA